MPREGHPVTPYLFVGKPRNIEAEPQPDPLLAALAIQNEIRVYVPDPETAKEVLRILGAEKEHAHNAVHYAD